MIGKIVEPPVDFTRHFAEESMNDYPGLDPDRHLERHRVTGSSLPTELFSVSP